MKANELRIGNYVKDRGSKIMQIDSFEYKTKVCSKEPILGFCEFSKKPILGHPLTEEISFLQPIHLTKEILLKCGFVIKNNWALKPNFCLGWIITDEYYQIEVKIAGIEKWNILEVKYLHQLQNLYHALTGEELTVIL